MPKFDITTSIGVLGAGTMGQGIAQVAATAGHAVVLYDSSRTALENARSGLSAILQRQVDKKRMSQSSADGILGRINFAHDPYKFATCGLIIEAIVEDLAVKRNVYSQVESIVPPDCILASNTSSLPIAAIGASCDKPERMLGAHFFNPAPLMPLVEIIPGVASAADVVQATCRLIDRWGKTTVLAKDTPGFIVNRVARPFYGEALRLLEEGMADVATIDWAMKEIGGFRMGPFELMDFIGNDINYAVTETVFAAFFYDPRYRPSFTQKRLVEAGYLGRKTGRGHYDYRPGAENPAPRQDRPLGEQIFKRILAMLINEAADAVFWQIGSPEDIDQAMIKGVNYPKGLLQWADEIGLKTVLGQLEGLQKEYGEDRYRPSPLLRRKVRKGETFLSHG
ncbi:MAG: 3-hydroxybutyryl-CoA dehydrogenase [Calditrichaeota bacterium]|nr:3-hydroxybutyryl-CoA dehydrogenase [Calditrichota bacterium]MCB0303839.1 3-hydroxybutyryl-CoA dehydrogenase [Calditrichota bacterium]